MLVTTLVRQDLSPCMVAKDVKIQILCYSDLTSFATYSICFQTQHFKPSYQIRTYGSEDVFMSVNYHDQDLSFDLFTEFREQNPIGKAEESEEPLPESTERTMSLSKLLDGPGLIAAVVKMLRTLI